MSDIELCKRLLAYSVWSKHTENLTAQQIKKNVELFFPADVVEEAVYQLSQPPTEGDG